MNEKIITGFQGIAFDLDGVLVEEPSSWWTLHKAFGTYGKGGGSLLLANLN